MIGDIAGESPTESCLGLDGSRRGPGPRPHLRRHKIGQPFADDERIANALFAVLCNSGVGGPVFMDIPEPNRPGLSLAGGHGMAPESECARMYLRGDPGLPLGRISGFTAFEVG